MAKHVAILGMVTTLIDFAAPGIDDDDEYLLKIYTYEQIASNYESNLKLFSTCYDVN